MLSKGMGVLVGCLAMTSLCASTVSVFVSFSMPEMLLEETLKESSLLHIPVYLNGLYQDSMPETALKIMALSARVPNLTLQIDPTLFEQFGIQQVPALVVANGEAFDVIYGNLPLKEGLARMAGRGDSGFSVTEARGVF
ncbi:conjugative transfer protein [Legionella beliardensis]|uniref:Conjugative transfer protein n=2 Tax=Legionella beliardensis TaxID=91822 RepID=A0A378JR94_9GAMM|nr:conjugative transfer protein [Legionella beliardensis]